MPRYLVFVKREAVCSLKITKDGTPDSKQEELLTWGGVDGGILLRAQPGNTKEEAITRLSIESGLPENILDAYQIEGELFK